MRLREVLDAFENNGPRSLGQMSQDLGVEPGMLDSMIQFWVQKGKLREVCDSGCSSCSAHGSCPIVVSMPRRYELVTDANAEQPRCSCCH